MNGFEVYNPENAPEGSRKLLERTLENTGFIPNLIGGMAVAPSLAEGYMKLAGIFAKSSFDATEQQIVLLAISRYNGCEYCMAAHSSIASMQNVPQGIIDAMRDDAPIADGRLEALRQFATAVVDQRGWVEETMVKAFLDAGFTRQQVGEVILGVGLKTMSNYFNHIAETELDEAFRPTAWTLPTPPST